MARRLRPLLQAAASVGWRTPVSGMAWRRSGVGEACSWFPPLEVAWRFDQRAARLGLYSVPAFHRYAHSRSDVCSVGQEASNFLWRVLGAGCGRANLLSEFLRAARPCR